jgi:hypothetical protein
MALRISGLLLFAASLSVRASEALAGHWEGAAQIPGREIRLVIDLVEDGSGHWAGSAIVPGFGIKGTPLSEILIKDSNVSFALKGALGDPRLEGHLTSNGTLSGEFKQAGNTAPFELRNAGPAAVEIPPDSTAVRKELEGEWKGDMSYAGTQFHVSIKLENRSDGKATGRFVVIGSHKTDLAISLVTLEGEMLTVEMYERGMTYEGRFMKDQNEINGAFRQSGVEIPLILHPAAKP